MAGTSEAAGAGTQATTEGVGADGWLNNKTIAGLWAIDQDRNAWAFVSDVGWQRIAFDNDNIFQSMLRQLASAKGANRPVNVYVQGGVIRQVYVL